MALTRRGYLAVLGGCAVAGTAGCQGLLGADDHRTYRDWVRTFGAEDAVSFATLDWRRFADVGGDPEYLRDPFERGLDLEAYSSDPMAFTAVNGLLSAGRGPTGRVHLLNLDGLFADAWADDSQGEDDGGGLDATVEWSVRTHGAHVLAGSFDADRIDARLTGSVGVPWTTYERVDAERGYDRYVPDEDHRRSDFPAEHAIAVDEDVLVFATGDDALETVGETLETGHDGVDRATEVHEDVAWMLDVAGAGDAVSGYYRAPFAWPEEDLPWPWLAEARGVVASLTFDAPDERSVAFAAVLGDPDEVAVRQAIGSSADDRTVDLDGDRVTAEARWEL